MRVRIYVFFFFRRIQEIIQPTLRCQSRTGCSRTVSSVWERRTQIATPTKLPLRGAHGLHHPDGQGGLQHGHPHVGEAEGSCWEREQGKHSSLAAFCCCFKQGQVNLCIQRCVLPPGRTCSHQDEGVSQEGDQRCPSGALWGGKGGKHRLRSPCALAPNPSSAVGPGELPLQPHLHTSVHTHLYKHTRAHLGGDLGGLQNAELQSWEENTEF